MLSALVGLISTSDLGMGWYSLASHLARHVHSHHKCYRLSCFILCNCVYYDTGHFMSCGK